MTVTALCYTQFKVSGMWRFSETFWILGTKSTDFINLWLNPHFPYSYS